MNPFSLFAQCCLLLVFPLLVSCGPDECTGPIKQFVNCLREEVDVSRAGELAEAGGAFSEDISKCFTLNKCSPPDFQGDLDRDLNPKAQGEWGAVVSWWDSLQNDKRHCVVTEVRGDFRDALVTCVRKNIPDFNITSDNRDKTRLGNVGRGEKKSLAGQRFRIRQAYSKCPNARDVHICSAELRNRNVMTKQCGIRAKCAAQLSPTCQELYKASFRDPICMCVRNSAKELTGNGEETSVIPDSVIETKCGVKPPNVNVTSIVAQHELHLRIKDYISLYEDRVVSYCHMCDKVDV